MHFIGPYIISISLVALDSLKSFRGVMMGVLSDKYFKISSLGAAICLKNSKCFVQHLLNLSEADSRFTNEIASGLKNSLVTPKRCGQFYVHHRSIVEYGKIPIFYQHIMLDIFEQLLSQELSVVTVEPGIQKILVFLWKKKMLFVTWLGMLSVSSTKKFAAMDFLVEKEIKNITESY